MMECLRTTLLFSDNRTILFYGYREFEMWLVKEIKSLVFEL